MSEPQEASWKAQVLSMMPLGEAFAVPRPIADDRGDWVRDGWEALEWVPGFPDESRVLEVVSAGSAFHRALELTPAPAFLGAADDAWSRADRAAWGELPLPDDVLFGLAAAEFESVDGPSQLIHGDLLGNVLFSEGRPPTVIDWAPYWRPVGLGAAIVVVDAVSWHDYPVDRLSESFGIPQWRQLLIRAFLFRVVTLYHLGHWDGAQSKRHAPVLAAILDVRE